MRGRQFFVIPRFLATGFTHPEFALTPGAGWRESHDDPVRGRTWLLSFERDARLAQNARMLKGLAGSDSRRRYRPGSDVAMNTSRLENDIQIRRPSIKSSPTRASPTPASTGRTDSTGSCA